MRSSTWLGLTAFLPISTTARNLPPTPDFKVQGSDDRQYATSNAYDLDTAVKPDSVSPTRPKPWFPHMPLDRPTGFIALGDSYSAGIGTGVNGTEVPCRLGLHAYPALVHKDLEDQEGVNATTFQFLSCTGSTIEDLLLNSDPSQIGDFNTTQTADFALLSVGGNDLGFFNIMNSCIFRFYSFYSGTCEEALARAEVQLASPDFENHLRLAITEILDRVQWEKRPWFTITVTGYAQFFNAETLECDNSSFGVWWRGPKLKRKLRRKMNEMVKAVNEKIRRSIDAVNEAFVTRKVIFVDYDRAFEGHRFCEPNVTEPDYTRNETWFFLVGGSDNAGNSTGNTTTEAATLTSSDLLPPTSPLIDTRLCMEAAEKSGDWGQLSLCMMATALENDSSLRLSGGDSAVDATDMWYVPTYYGQTFHPRTQGHKAIRDQIYLRWEEEFGILNV